MDIAVACALGGAFGSTGQKCIASSRLVVHASVHDTQSLARANDFRRNVKTGCVMINLPTAGTDYHVPFGGRGESSYGSRDKANTLKSFILM